MKPRHAAALAVRDLLRYFRWWVQSYYGTGSRSERGGVMMRDSKNFPQKRECRSMYRGDDFLISEPRKTRLFLVPRRVEVGPYHRLAEAIRRGCLVHPKKVKEYFWSGEQWACALGAAWSGVAKEPPRGDIYDALPSVFPELGHFVTHPLTGERAAAMQVVNNLNEQTRYSREAIADWLSLRVAASIGCADQ
jgi:hypothetical protein